MTPETGRLAAAARSLTSSGEAEAMPRNWRPRAPDRERGRPWSILKTRIVRRAVSSSPRDPKARCNRGRHFFGHGFTLPDRNRRLRIPEERQTGLAAMAIRRFRIPPQRGLSDVGALEPGTGGRGRWKIKRERFSAALGVAAGTGRFVHARPRRALRRIPGQERLDSDGLAGPGDIPKNGGGLKEWTGRESCKKL